MSNRLAHEKSPYLLQHAENPVDWRPWGDAAFAEARGQQKPIFLSIGYSTCHWCHVMAHESFENPSIAQLLNEHFIPIKVDREERPDVDRVYMTYLQALTGHGGWPLSAWLTPELKPFYAGTYFPPDDRHGRPGFPALLRTIAGGWANERDKLVTEADRMIATLRSRADEAAPATSAPGKAAVEDLLNAASEAFEKGFQHFYESFDAENGGFGGAPKFPRASNLNFLDRCAALQGAKSAAGAEAVKMSAQTLQKMAQGGIHDHVGGGFHRYAVDETWFVPHFEKMLYDQAQIALNCLTVRRATGDERYAWLARDIFEYVARDLTSPAGGFYSAEDADSAPGSADGERRTGDGEQETGDGGRKAEGAFYVWTLAEITQALGEDAPWFCAHFGVAETGNVPPQLDTQREFVGKNILAQRQSLAVTARAYGFTPEQANGRLIAALETLRTARGQRPRPHLDDKIITAWNGLMISALAQGAALDGRSLHAGDERAASRQARGHEPVERASRLLQTAVRAAEFLERELYDAPRGVLYRSYREGRSAIEGFAEDYAFLIQGLLDLYEAGFDWRWLRWAERLQQTMDALFWDEVRGGYFNSAAGDPGIVLRLKEDYDGAEPSPSSVAALNLLRLAAVFDDQVGTPPAVTTLSYRERALRTLGAFRSRWHSFPQTLPQMLCALELALESSRHVVLAGSPRTPELQALATVVRERTGPHWTLLCADGGEGQAWLAQRAPWLAEMKPVDGRPTAYVCEDFACRAPITDAAELRAALAR